MTVLKDFLVGSHAVVLFFLITDDIFEMVLCGSIWDITDGQLEVALDGSQWFFVCFVESFTTLERGFSSLQRRKFNICMMVRWGYNW